MGAIEGGTGRALVLTAALMSAGGRAQIGDARYDPRSTYARATVIDGEIRGVDARRGRIRVRSPRHGMRTIRVDRSTRVLYRRIEYTLEALEPGDQVRVFVAVDRSGRPWAERVDVRTSADEHRDGERPPRPREYAWLDGTVGRLDPSDGWFTVEMGRPRGAEGEIVVYVPDQLDRDDERRLGRIRRGDRVQIEVRPISGNEAELVGFR